MKELEIPVPEAVFAGYEVPLPTLMEEPEIRRITRKAVQVRLSGPLRIMVVKGIDEGTVVINAEAKQPQKSPPEGSPAYGTAAQRDYYAKASGTVQFSAASRPTLLAMQEWKARGAAAAFAADLGAPVLDMREFRTLTADEALSTLPDTKMAGTKMAGTKMAGTKMSGPRRMRGDNPLITIEVPFTSWVRIRGALWHEQAWMFTEGMRRFGLPEMRIGGASPKLREELTAILTGVAFKLYHGLLQREMRGSRLAASQVSPPRVIRVPAEMDISRAEVDQACKVDNRGGGCTRIGLRFHPAADEDERNWLDEDERNWLTVWPTSDWTLSMEDFIADICHALFGFEKPPWHYIPEFGALLEGMISAKVRAPELRDRFLRRDIPEAGQFLVRHRKAGSREFVWARVESWDDAEHLVVRDIGRELAPGVRPGSAVSIETGSIIDWAVWVDGKGVVEGAATEGRGRSLV